MSDPTADPFLVASAALACAAMALGGPPAGTLGAAAALVLVLPGYALSHALVPDARGVERLALSIGLSLAVSVVTGLGLAAGNQLTSGAWAAALAATTGLCALGMPESPAEPRRAERWRGGRWAIPLVALAALAVGVAESALLDEARAIWRSSGGTALSMLRRGPDDADLSLAVANAGQRDVTGVLTVEVPGLPRMIWPALTVASGRNWQVGIPVPAEAAGRIIARFATQEPDASVRKVTAWTGRRPEDGWTQAPAAAPAPVRETPGPDTATALAADARGTAP